MKKSLRILALILAFIMCLSLVACNSNVSSSSPSGASSSAKPSGSASAKPAASASAAPIPTPSTSGGVPVAADGAYGMPTGPDVKPPQGMKFADTINVLSDGNIVASMNPYAIGGAGLGPGTAWAMICTHDRLIQAPVPEAKNFDAGLAVSWSTKDSITYNFKLREGVTFQNGEKFTADDVIFTNEYAKSKTACAALTMCWAYVGTVNKVSDYEINVVAKDNKVNADLMTYLSGPYGAIINKKALTDDPQNGNYIGTGPYKLTSFVSQNSWTLERNEKFWGKPAITKKMNWRYVPEIANRTTMLQNGEAQLCMAVNQADMDLFQTNAKFTVFARLLNNANPISFNMSKPITGDLNFRMAVLYAISKPDFAVAYKGKYCQPGTDFGGMWGYYVPFRNTDLKPLPQDLAKAKEYLAKSKYKGEDLELAAITVGHQAGAPVFQQQLAAIGIKTHIKLMQYAELAPYIKDNKTELLLVTAPLNFMPSSIQSWYLPGAPSNSAHYDNPEVTKLINQALVEPDAAKREATWKQVQKLVYDDHAYEHLVWFMETVVGAKGIGGFTWCTDCYYNMRYIYYAVPN